MALMSSILTLLCGALGGYLIAVIAAAGLSVRIGGLTIGSFKLVNPAMAFLAVLFLRALWQRGGEVEADAEDTPHDARWLRIGWLALAVPLAVAAWSRALDGGFIREDFHRLERVLAGQPLNGATWSDAG